MTGISEISKLGYLIHHIWQDAPDSWHVCFKSPYEWQTWQAHGKSLIVAAKKAAKIARKRGPAWEASAEYRRRTAARFARRSNRERLDESKRIREKIDRIRL